MHLRSASNFVCYLIDNCEGEIISEEMLQHALIKFIDTPKYCPKSKPRGRKSTMSEQIERAQQDFVRYGLDRL